MAKVEISNYLREKYGIETERGDDHILTKPLMDKIREQILKADFIIGDITGGNPNVFYELGLAQAHNKPVIFLSQDPPDQAPVDIRQFEFIHYDLARHTEFLAKLDNAVQNVFVHEYKSLYESARIILQQFNKDCNTKLLATAFEEFQALVMKGEQTGGLPEKEDERLRAEFLLPKIIKDATEIAVMKQITGWIAQTFSVDE